MLKRFVPNFIMAALYVIVITILVMAVMANVHAVFGPVTSIPTR